MHHYVRPQHRRSSQIVTVQCLLTRQQLYPRWTPSKRGLPQCTTQTASNAKLRDPAPTTSQQPNNIIQKFGTRIETYPSNHWTLQNHSTPPTPTLSFLIFASHYVLNGSPFACLQLVNSSSFAKSPFWQILSHGFPFNEKKILSQTDDTGLCPYNTSAICALPPPIFVFLKSQN